MMNDIAQKLRTLANDIDNLADDIDKPKNEPAQPWPPKGVAIEVDLSNGRTHGEWYPFFAAGEGLFYSADRVTRDLCNYRWRYAPAPWDIAPQWAKCWVITDSGESCWVSDRWKKGERMSGGTLVHVEYREDK